MRAPQGRAAARRAGTGRLLPPGGIGLGWPRGGVRRVSDPERARLQHYERLMFMAHATVIPVALAAVMVGAGGGTAPSWVAASAVVCGALTLAAAYHVLLPRLWLSHAKVVLGLCLDTALVTATVHVTGGQGSLLVFLYYLIVVVSALTLESRALLAICMLVTVSFIAVLAADPVFTAEAGAGRAALFLVSVWLVGAMSTAGAAQIQAAERRLLEALHAEEATARTNATLSRDLAAQLESSRALAEGLAQQREQTRRLADMVIRAQEEERRRVARELHDEANQTLAALMTAVDLAEARASDGSDPELTAILVRLRRLAATALADLQRIALELRPPALDEFGLLPALKKHVLERTEATALRADVACEGRRRRLPDSVEIALYRIAQEAVANAQKHSRAGHLHVRLRFLAGAVQLDVSDDGCGFDCHDGSGGDVRSGLGIPGMRERAAIVGGGVEVSSRAGGGTRVSALIPLGDAAAAPQPGAAA